MLRSFKTFFVSVEYFSGGSVRILYLWWIIRFFELLICLFYVTLHIVHSHNYLVSDQMTHSFSLSHWLTHSPTNWLTDQVSEWLTNRVVEWESVRVILTGSKRIKQVDAVLCTCRINDIGHSAIANLIAVLHCTALRCTVMSKSDKLSDRSTLCKIVMLTIRKRRWREKQGRGSEGVICSWLHLIDHDQGKKEGN